MSLLQELLDKLPDYLQPWAKVYVELLEREAPEQVEIFVRLALTNGWAEAHKAMLTRMTSQEIIDEQAAGNALKRRLNEDQAAFLAAQQQAIIELLFKALSILV